MRRLALTFLFLSAGASPAFAENPVCADRPLAGEDSCTVPRGRVQVELGVIDWNHQRAGGAQADSLTLASPVLKYGLSSTTDVEVTITPFTRSVSHADGVRDAASGVGDSQFGLKHRFVDGPVSVAVLPSVSLPTASAGLGSGKVETSIALPVDIDLPMSLQLNLSPQLSRVANAEAKGYHLVTQLSAGLTVPLSSRWSIDEGIWAAIDRDPAGHQHQSSAETAITYAPRSDTQFDVEVDVGLTRATPGLGLLFGVSHLF